MVFHWVQFPNVQLDTPGIEEMRSSYFSHGIEDISGKNLLKSTGRTVML